MVGEWIDPVADSRHARHLDGYERLRFFGSTRHPNTRDKVDVEPSEFGSPEIGRHAHPEGDPTLGDAAPRCQHEPEVITHITIHCSLEAGFGLIEGSCLVVKIDVDAVSGLAVESGQQGRRALEHPPYVVVA